MLVKPDIPDDLITDRLLQEFGLMAAGLEFLPIGADRNTAVYRVEAAGGAQYFLKIRLQAFDPLSVELPHALIEQGIHAIIPPLPSLSGLLWGRVGDHTLILYPFIHGNDGYQLYVPTQAWVEFGRAVRQVHECKLPNSLRKQIRKEDFASTHRQHLLDQLENLSAIQDEDRIARKAVRFLMEHEQEVRQRTAQTESLAQELKSRPLPLTLCHADLHAGNLFIEESGRLFIVDWDDPILAPRERDLMFPGAGLFGGQRTPIEEKQLFFQGYGEVNIDPQALTYYRLERIIADLAVECDQIFDLSGAIEDRRQALDWMVSNFEPGGTLELAAASN